MGMFDDLRCRYPLPDPEAQEWGFQTKDFDCLMDDYTITEDGRLIKHVTRCEEVPEEDRPYFGKPEWDDDPDLPGRNSWFRLCGSIRRVPVEDREIPYHGDIRFYTGRVRLPDGTIADQMGSGPDGSFTRGAQGEYIYGESAWYEYTARFTNGRVEWIRREQDSTPTP